MTDSASSQPFDRPFNAAKHADEAVLALASLERGETPSQEGVTAATSLCKYLLLLIKGANEPGQTQNTEPFQLTRDRKAFQDHYRNVASITSDIQILQKQLLELRAAPNMTCPVEQLHNMQRLLVDVTMPLWQERTTAFRQRKLKRGLTFHA